MQRLNLIDNHFTSFPEEPNMLAKYRKLSNIDERFLADIYFMGNEDIVRTFESLILDNTNIFA